jgi:carboxyl-terminal processing protease
MFVYNPHGDKRPFFGGDTLWLVCLADLSAAVYTASRHPLYRSNLMLQRSWRFSLLAFFVLAVPAIAAAKGPPSKPKDTDYDLVKTLVDAIDQIGRNYATEVDRHELIDSAIRGMLNKLDPYSTYIAADEAQQFRARLLGEFGGIGIQIAADDGRLTVLSPIYGTPAYRAGILAGDRILEIDGRSTEGLNVDEAAKRLHGEEGAPVTLTVLHPGKHEKTKINLVREKIHLETVLGDRRKPDGRWEFILDLNQHIGYVRLTAFSSDTAAELRRVLSQLQKDKLRGLILDLRFNPGGLLSAGIEVSDLFVSEGRIVSTKGRNSPEHAWDAHKEGTYSGFPMAVLVNRFSASSSEIVAACLQDHKRAVVIGERTWGKGSVQTLIQLDNGRSLLKLTTASYRRPNGKNIHRFLDAKETDEWGVMPDAGFKIEPSDEEMIRLIQDRRRRDVLPSPAKDGEKGPEGKEKTPRPVDRQLQAAMKYLTEELARKP